LPLANRLLASELDRNWGCVSGLFIFPLPFTLFCSPDDEKRFGVLGTGLWLPTVSSDWTVIGGYSIIRKKKIKRMDSVEES
jgi:hypothetical protein